MTRRRLTALQRLKVFEANEGVCHICERKVQAGEAWDISHLIPLELGGPDTEANWLVAHRTCHRTHTAEVDAPAIAKSRRIRIKHAGAKSPSRMPGSRASRWKRKLDGTTVLRRAPDGTD